MPIPMCLVEAMGRQHTDEGLTYTLVDAALRWHALRRSRHASEFQKEEATIALDQACEHLAQHRA